MYDIGNDLVPAMTSGTTDGVSVTAIGNIGGGYEGWRAFDDSASDTMWNDGEVTENWLKVDFGTGKTVAAYTIKARTSYLDDCPRDWTLEGSNNDVDWTVLDEQAGEANWASEERREYVLDMYKVGSYRYYKLVITENNGSTGVAIREMELLAGTEADAVSGYDDYREITIDNTKVDATLPDYPIKVVLDSSNFDFADVLSEGNDIVFTDEYDKLLYFEVESYDATAELAVFHIRVHSIASAADTVIRMHYGKSGMSPTYQYDNGTETVAWNSFTIGSFTGTLSKEADHLKIITGGSSGGQGGFVTNAEIDLTDIDILSANVDIDAGGSRIFDFYITTSKTDPWANMVASIDVNDIDLVGDLELDVSGYTGNHYVAVHSRNWGSVGTYKIYDVKIPATTLDNKTGVWTDYAGVWHMQDGKDSSPNGNDLTVNGATQIAGLNGKAYSFDGVNDYLESNGHDFDYPLTMQALTYIDYALSTDLNVLQIGNPGVTNQFLTVDYQHGVGIRQAHYDGSWTTLNSVAIGAAGYALASAVYVNNDFNLFVNGASPVQNTGTYNKPSTQSRLAVGAFRDSSPAYKKGIFCEVRVSTVPRSDAWLKADDYNLRLNTLLTVGAEQGGGTPAANRRFVQLI
jgi:hypothetical protein